MNTKKRQQKDGRAPFLTATTLIYAIGAGITAAAAFLRCGSRFSGSLSGIEPQSSVTRQSHGSPIHYHRKLMGQKLE
ncbi:hypothetical protein FGO68_gene4564 [Halteria grandinella]|uniref:Uncharacterized protein n=1 Tax=Halteria grandinella TaxID=5974 RepID=A0A8J8SUN2_HALGN|nr:hypothetical protein FGO68_gene4564 [Halteria grandinella]